MSVLDSGFMLGDGVWEGLRVVNGVVAFAAPHMARLYEGAKAIDMDIGVTKAQLLQVRSCARARAVVLRQSAGRLCVCGACMHISVRAAANAATCPACPAPPRLSVRVAAR